MNSITLMLLTVVVNAIVTGIIVYLIQKRIEHSYAQRAFEDQLKFKRLHEKRVEALETFYQKFVVFSDNLNEIIENIRTGVPIDRKDYEEVEKQADKVYGDLRQYFDNNRLFLSDNINDQMGKIIITCGLLEPIITTLFWDSAVNGFVLDEWVDRWADTIIKLFDLEESSLDLKNPDVLLREMSKIMERQARTLEKLYKSVADATDKG